MQDDKAQISPQNQRYVHIMNCIQEYSQQRYPREWLTNISSILNDRTLKVDAIKNNVAFDQQKRHE